MRLLEFPCVWWTGRPEDSSPPAAAAAAAAGVAVATLATAASDAAVAAAGTELFEKRRRKSSPWRPSLVAIDEDGAAVFRNTAAAKKVGGDSRPAGKVKSAGRVTTRGGHVNNRHYGVPVVVTAFAPTPFLF